MLRILPLARPALALCLLSALLLPVAGRAQSATSMERPGDAYQSGYERGRSDAGGSLPPDSNPPAQWSSSEARTAFRQGYSAGFSAGQAASASTPSPSAGAMASPSNTSAGDADRFGYQDGLAAGRRDRDSGHSFRPTDGDMYKKGDHGWSADFGDRDHYRQLYRQSYARGYQEGFGQQ